MTNMHVTNATYYCIQSNTDLFYTKFYSVACLLFVNTLTRMSELYPTHISLELQPNLHWHHVTAICFISILIMMCISTLPLRWGSIQTSNQNFQLQNHPRLIFLVPRHNNFTQLSWRNFSNFSAESLPTRPPKDSFWNSELLPASALFSA